MEGELTRAGDAAVSLAACRGRRSHEGWVLSLGAHDVLRLAWGPLRVEARREPRAPLSDSSYGDGRDDRWLQVLAVTGVASALCLAALNAPRVGDVGRGGSSELATRFVHLVAQAKRPATERRAAARASPRRGASARSVLAAVLGDVGCLCKPCWVNCGRAVVAPPRAIRCERGSCAEAELVREVLRAHLAQVRYCVKAFGHWTRDQEALGLAMDVAPSGDVASVRVAHVGERTAGAAECVLSRVRRWRFPAHPHGAYAVSFQWRLRWEFDHLAQ